MQEGFLKGNLFCRRFVGYNIQKSLMSTESLKSQNYTKIYFKIRKRVEFGQAVYVVGSVSQLGSWSVNKSLRLTWNSDDVWSGSIKIVNTNTEAIEFKYAIALWDCPESSAIQWEAGKHNRVANVDINKNPVICENTWNMDRITLNLLIDSIDYTGQEYYVIGNCKQLGEWSRTVKMVGTSISQSALNKLQLEGYEKKYGKVFSYSFQIYRGKRKIHYYYMKKSDKCQIERQPGRRLYLDGKSFHSRCLKILHPAGDMELYEECYFTELNYSKITDSIFLGSYLHTCEDFDRLKKEGVSAILSIQSDRDFLSHGISPHYIEILAQQYGISLYKYSIEDMDAKDFREKCQGALILLKKLILASNKKVYVHCSAGMYRSPQIVVLHLIINEGYSLEYAIKFVTSKHPFANPNLSLVNNVLQDIGKENKTKIKKVANLN